MKCPNCGAEIRHDDRYCQYCGGSLIARIPVASPAPQQTTVRVTVDQPPPRVVEIHHYHETTRTVRVSENISPKNRGISLLLCVFLGWLGVHKFYEGKIFTGIFYLFTFGVFGLGIFVDIVRLLLGHPVDGKGRIIKW